MGYLTGPVSTLVDYQIEFNGFLLGPNTNYDIPPTWDFLDMANLKTMDTARVWADGSWSGPDFADVLLPTVNLEIKGSTQADFVASIVALRAVLSPATVAVPLWVKLPGMAAMGIPAKTMRRSIPVDMTWNGNFSQAAVQWRCPDPQWQGVPRTVSLSAAGASVSGLQFPIGVPASGLYPTATTASMDYGSTVLSGSSAILTNSGNTPAWPVVVINGPTTAPATVIIDGNQVTYSQTIPSGQSVTIDYKVGSATLTGGVDRTYALTSRNFSAVSTSSAVLYSATSGTVTATVADLWR